MAQASEKIANKTREFQHSVSEVLQISGSMHSIVNAATRNIILRTVEIDHVVWKTDLYKTILGLTAKTADDFADHTQ